MLKINDPLAINHFQRVEEQKKDFSTIQDAEFEDLSESESSIKNKDSAMESQNKLLKIINILNRKSALNKD